MPHPQPPPDPGARAALDTLAALDRWLAAERSGVDAEVAADTAADAAAEAAFAELLVGLQRPAPPPGFADRVLARARQAPRRRWLGWRAPPGGAPGGPAPRPRPPAPAA